MTLGAPIILISGEVRETLFAQPLMRALPDATIFSPPGGLSTLLGLDLSGRAFGLGDGGLEWIKAWRRLRREPVSLAVLPPPVRPGRALLAYLQAIPYRIKAQGEYDWCATESVTVPAGMHPVEVAHRLVAAVAATPSQARGAPEIVPSEIVRRRIDGRLAAVGLPPGQRLLVLIPGRGNWRHVRATRSWPPERFAIAANELAGGPVLLVRGIGDNGAVRETAAGIRFPTHVLDLGELAPPELAVVMRRSLGVIGHDGDALHVAAASGARVLGLLGPTDIGPYGSSARELRVDDLPSVPARPVVQAAQELWVSSYG